LNGFANPLPLIGDPGKLLSTLDLAGCCNQGESTMLPSPDDLSTPRPEKEDVNAARFTSMESSISTAGLAPLARYELKQDGAIASMDEGNRIESRHAQLNG
jgi:hypothetical protein